MIISLIVAASENNIIGKDNQMIWHMPADLMYFKKVTLDHHIIMGRKNFEAMNKPLPGRTNIIITRQNGYHKEGCIVVHSLEEGLTIAEGNGETEAMIIGGGEIYRLALPIAHKIYLTRIHGTFEGDTSFPEIDKNNWVENTIDVLKSDDANPYDYTFLVYERK